MDDDMASEVKWMRYAACKGSPVDLFMPKRGEVRKIQAARKICADCPVLKACREYSIQAAQETDLDGVFGGWTKLERRKHMKSLGVHPRRTGYSNIPMPKTDRRLVGSHGTASAYLRHIRANEDPCEQCSVAQEERRYRAAMRKRKANLQ